LAHAEIALLRNGMTLKVEAWGTLGANVHLKLKDGGEVGVPGSLLVGVVPDEIVEQVEEARKSGGDVEALLRDAAARNGLDPMLVRAVVGVESAFRKDALSPKGAQGLMQLMPATAAALGVTDAFDPAQNLDAGARHLAALVQGYGGDLTKALAAYNAGAGAVARHGGVPPYRETQDYVARVLKRYRAGM
jgi:soluble lytic murein transglycosylase-like protein